MILSFEARESLLPFSKMGRRLTDEDRGVRTLTARERSTKAVARENGQMARARPALEYAELLMDGSSGQSAHNACHCCCDVVKGMGSMCTGPL